MSENRSAVDPMVSENHFATLYEEAPLGYQSLDAEGRVLQVNRTWLELLGYARDEVIGRSFADFLTVAQRPCFAERFARFKAAGEVRGVEFEMVRKDGGTFMASFDGRIARDEHGRFLRTHCIFSDVTERWQAEQALRESALRQAMAVQAGNVGLWDWDLLTNKVVYSKEWKSQIGYKEDEISDSFEEWRSRVHPEDLGSVSNEIQAYIAQRRPGYVTEFRFRHKDGSFRWIMAHASVITDDAGRAVRVMGTHIDITRAKNDEERLAAMEAQLRHAGRLAALGALTAGIAHEVNQPLCAILNFANACKNVAMQENPDMALIIQWSDAIAAAAARSGDIVRRMSRFSRRSAGGFREVSVRELVEDAALLVRFEARQRNVAIVQRFPDEEFVVTVHPVGIHQVLVNLLRNAIEAFAENGSNPRQVVVAVETTGDKVRFRITDNGPGVAKADLCNLFEPFFTTKAEGLGLGLSISRTIVENHGGRIGAAANEEGGLTVSFTLPIKHGEG